MFAKIKKGLKKRKVKLFFVFLLCSFLAWFVSNLSETYTSGTTFDLNFTRIPEDKLLLSASKEKLDVKLEAVGFQFLRFNFGNKDVDIDLSTVSESEGRYFVTPDQFQQQIEKQLSNSMRLIQIVDDTLFFEFDALLTKEVPVEPDIELDLNQNYFLEGQIRVDPPMITITGPSNEVDTIVSLTTPRMELNDLSSDFSQTTIITIPDSLINSTFSHKNVVVSGVVAKFSEKIIAVPVQVLNLPAAMTIQTFPEEIEILCKASVSNLKTIRSSDFRVVADYKQVTGANQRQKTLSLTLQKKPKNVFDATLIQDKVAYILKNK